MSDINDPTLNVNIANDGNTKLVTVITDGSVERLAVDANVTGGVILQRFTPKFSYSTANTALNTSTNVTLINISDDAQLDFIAITGSLATYEVAIVIDTVEVLRINMNDLGATLALANATNVPIWADTANKNFRFSPRTPIDFISNITVKAKATAGSPTVNWLINYRSLV